jgi:hypothetical protein
MVRYRTAWFFGVAVFGAIGTWAAVDALSWGGVLTILLLATCVGVSVALVPVKEDDARPLRRAMSVGVASGAAVVAAAGLMSMFGAWGAAVVAVMAASSPPVVTRGRRWYARLGQGLDPDEPPGPKAAGYAAGETFDPGYGAGAVAAPPVDPSFLSASWMRGEPESLDDASLCLAWRKTYVALQRVHAPAWKLLVAQRREELLDELERRNASGFEAWLAAGARAAGDPSRFILATSRPSDPRHRS